MPDMHIEVGSAEELTNITRRTLFNELSLTLLALSTPLRAFAKGFPADIPCVIDAHCHVFNGRDVPAGQFVLDVAAREQNFEKYKFIAQFAVEIVRRFAPLASRELDDLPGGNHPVPALSDAQFQEHVTSTLNGLRDQARVSPTPLSRREAGFDALAPSGKGIDPQTARFHNSYLNSSALAIVALQSNYAGHLKGRHEAFTPDSKTPAVQSELSQIARAIVDDVRAFFSGGVTTDLAPYMAVIRIFISRRSENVRRLDSAMGMAVPSRARLYCPALIDYDYWLDTDILTKSTPLDEQCSVMAAVSRNTDQNVIVAGYAAFDPLRAAIDSIQGKPYQASALGMVDAAIHTKGFIGAKLYPPMGFRAWNNAHINDGYGFGPNVPSLVHATLVRAKRDPQHFELGAALDGELDRLYKFCLKNNVPILAHCGNSQTAFPGSGVRASPVYWESLLQRPGFGHLRVNLGHFGGIWCHGQDNSGGTDENDRCEVSEGQAGTDRADWPAKIVTMIGRHDAKGQLAFPNLYFDIADLSALDDSTLHTALAKYTNLILGNDKTTRTIVLRRMMFGTDWMFLALQPNYRNFVNDVIQFAHDIGMNPSDLFWKNAARFLGLNKTAHPNLDQGSLGRLWKFYEGNLRKQQTLHSLLV